MRKFILINFLLLYSMVVSAQFATNFNCNDCDGNNHDLFTELDSGKVIVLNWVMPCGSCIGPSLTTSMVIKSIDSIHPGRVLMYLIDDYANTNCSSLNSWANSNNLKGITTFSDASIKMLDYGSIGMPKIVVVGGSEHKVYYNADNSVDPIDLKESIISALNEYSAGIPEKLSTINNFLLFPNPSSGLTTADFTLKRPSDVVVRILDASGKPVFTLRHDAMLQGKNQIQINTNSLSNGIYILELTDGISGVNRLLVVSE
ncbi:MAG: T9SS type A sorting domain-containing protein [Lentimicrobium sp.]|nr:T9SS type A sorting domain-containing protein [Lentimicrobium sp.]